MHPLQTFIIHHQPVELFVPDEEQMKALYNRGEIPFPYWSKVWPAAEALAHFILAHPHFTAGKNVVELGAGLGLPSLVAAQNAASVLCTDYAPEAVAVARQSALHNKLTNFATAIIDWHRVPQNLAAGIVLLSDINYEPAAFDDLQKLVQRFINEGATILLSTPQRLPAKGFIEPLLAFCTKQEELTVTQSGIKMVLTVMVLER